MNKLFVSVTLFSTLASAAAAAVFEVRNAGHESRSGDPVVITCMDGETRPEVGNSPVVEMDVQGALAAPLSMGYTVFSGEACIQQFEDAAQENGWDYIITPVQ